MSNQPESNFSKYIKSKGWTLEEFAELLNISTRSMSRRSTNPSNTDWLAAQGLPIKHVGQGIQFHREDHALYQTECGRYSIEHTWVAKRHHSSGESSQTVGIGLFDDMKHACRADADELVQEAYRFISHGIRADITADLTPFEQELATKLREQERDALIPTVTISITACSQCRYFEHDNQEHVTCWGKFVCWKSGDPEKGIIGLELDARKVDTEIDAHCPLLNQSK